MVSLTQHAKLKPRSIVLNTGAGTQPLIQKRPGKMGVLAFCKPTWLKDGGQDKVPESFSGFLELIPASYSGKDAGTSCGNSHLGFSKTS